MGKRVSQFHGARFHSHGLISSYFDEILRQTPDSVEDVMVEADGQWHTTDNKYGSIEWMTSHPRVTSSSSSPSKKPPTPSYTPSCPPSNINGSGQANGKGKASDVEIFVLDSDDDEDEGRVKRELSPSYASSTGHSFDGTLPHMAQTQSQSQSQSSTQFIDLTLDDSDEDEIPLVSHAQGKRRATESDLDDSADLVWKKARVDPSSRILPVPQGSSIPNNVTPVPHTSLLNNHTPASPSHYQSVFPGNILPPPTVNTYPGYTARMGPTNSSLHLPPLTNPYRQPPNPPRWRQG